MYRQIWGCPERRQYRGGARGAGDASEQEWLTALLADGVDSGVGGLEHLVARVVM